MNFTHKLESAVFAQGWVGRQIEAGAQSMSEGTEQEQTLAAQLLEMWAVVDVTMDELIRENGELRNKLELAQNALK